MTQHNLPAGWGRPIGARCRHYYRAGQLMALCGKWWFAGDRVDKHHNASENCPDCRAAHTAQTKDQQNVAAPRHNEQPS